MNTVEKNIMLLDDKTRHFSSAVKHGIQYSFTIQVNNEIT